MVAAVSSITGRDSRSGVVAAHAPPAVVRPANSRQERMSRMNPKQKGAVGEITTIDFLRKNGWTHLSTKSGKDDRGIDAVLQKGNELLLIESKINSSRLVDGQMSDEWIQNSLAAAERSKKKQVRSTARTVKHALAEGMVKKQLWRHNISEGKASVHTLDESGKPQKDEAPQLLEVSRFLDRAIARVLKNVR